MGDDAPMVYTCFANQTEPGDDRRFYCGLLQKPDEVPPVPEFSARSQRADVEILRR